MLCFILHFHINSRLNSVRKVSQSFPVNSEERTVQFCIRRELVQSHDDINCTYLKEPCIIKLVSNLIKCALLIGSRLQSLNLLAAVLCWIIYLKGNMLHCADIDCRGELWRINRFNLLCVVRRSCRSWTVLNALVSSSRPFKCAHLRDLELAYERQGWFSMSCKNMRNFCGATGMCGLVSVWCCWKDPTAWKPDSGLSACCSVGTLSTEQFLRPCRVSGLQQTTVGNCSGIKQE